jgi:hypothetical protein
MPRCPCARLSCTRRGRGITGLGIYPKSFFYARSHEALGDGARARLEYEAARCRASPE